MLARSLPWLVAALLIALPACDSADLASLDPHDDPRNLDTGLEDWLAEFRRVLIEDDAEGYLALLHEDFEFFHFSSITWAGPDSWGKDDERIIARNFVEPGRIPWGSTAPRDAIWDVDYRNFRDVEVTDGEASLRIGIELFIGFSDPEFDANLVFVIEPDGRWRLRSWRATGAWRSLRVGYHTLPSLSGADSPGWALRTAVARRDVESYRLLLTPEALAGEFRFHPRVEDQDTMPWLTDGYWDVDEELGMIERLFAGTPTGDGALVSLDVYPRHIRSSLQEPDRVESLFVVDVTLARDAAPLLGFTSFLTFDLRVDEGGNHRIQQVWESTPPGWSSEGSWGRELAKVRDSGGVSAAR